MSKPNPETPEPMIALPSLYPHQIDLRDRTRTALAKHGRVILCMPPGGGKTRLAKFVMGASANREPLPNQTGRSLFTVHRRGLVDNAADSFNEDPAVPHGIIMSGRDTNYGRRIQIASIDTMLSWFLDEGGKYPSDVTFDLIVWDEAHSHHPKFAKFLKYHDARREALGQNPAYVIGLTATPKAQGLADVYKEIVLGPSTQWLIENKFLSPFRYFRATQGKLGLLVKRGGEFTKDSESLAMDGLAGDLVRDWKKFAEGRPTVGFFPRRSHAKDALEQLTAAGLKVGYVDGETPDDERKKIFRALNEHWIDYLCNVQVVERGTDIPRIGCVQLCVAIGSNVRYRQIIGRGSRVHPAKTDAIILDHGGNVLRHGFFEDDPQWSLDITTKEPGDHKTRPTIECPKCSAIYRGGKCRSCGYEPSHTERRGQGLEFDGSELKEVKREEKPAQVRSAESLMISALYMAGKSGRTWKQAVGIFRSLCEKQGTKDKVPSTVQVAGRRYKCVRYGSPDSNRRVSALYPFTAGGNHGGEYLVIEPAMSESPY
jgi:DNA repair protein RadD